MVAIGKNSVNRSWFLGKVLPFDIAPCEKEYMAAQKCLEVHDYDGSKCEGFYARMMLCYQTQRRYSQIYEADRKNAHGQLGLWHQRYSTKKKKRGATGM